MKSRIAHDIAGTLQRSVPAVFCAFKIEAHKNRVAGIDYLNGKDYFCDVKGSYCETQI